MTDKYVALIMKSFYKTRNDTLCRDIRHNEIICKEYLSLRPDILRECAKQID